jgi:hypothetical protein
MSGRLAMTREVSYMPEHPGPALFAVLGSPGERWLVVVSGLAFLALLAWILSICYETAT